MAFYRKMGFVPKELDVKNGYPAQRFVLNPERESRMRTPVLETERLILRPFAKEDAQEVFECWESDPDVAKYMCWTSHNDINKTKQFIEFELGNIEKDDWYRWCLVEKSSGRIVGTCLIYYDEEVKDYEVGYNLGKKYWGQGFTTEAMQEAIRFAKEELKIKELVGSHAKENPASGSVMRKLGFVYEKDCPYPCNDGTVMREGMIYRLTL